MEKQTAVEWLWDMLLKAEFINNPEELLNQAKAMEKEQMDKACEDWWNEGASYMYDGKRKYESFEQYYNETFKSE